MKKERNRKKRQSVLRRRVKLFFRKIRSRLKGKLYRGGRVSQKLRRKYHLRSIGHYIQKSIYHRKGLKEIEIKIPQHFCFFADPIGANKFFRNIRRIICKRKPCNYYITHEGTKTIGLAASFLFDQMIKEERDYWVRRGIAINFRGKISESSQVNNFLLSFGILKELGISTRKFPPESFDHDYQDKYVTLKMTGSKHLSYEKGEASCQLVDYFDKCFNYNDLAITPDAKRDLIDSIGEIVGNAEEHCGNETGNWFALGCYNKENHNCSFAIINYGKTIYENLSDEKSTAADVISKIKKVIDRHRPMLERTYGLITKQHEEPIWNLMALQDGISSLRTSGGKGRTRGQGIMDVLSFIEYVKSKKEGARMSLISGSSAIIIDYTYPIVKKAVGKNQELRRILTMNKQQDLKYPPDKDKVIWLKEKFEGVIFAGSFIIDKKYLMKKLEKNHGKNN